MDEWSHIRNPSYYTPGTRATYLYIPPNGSRGIGPGDAVGDSHGTRGVGKRRGSTGDENNVVGWSWLLSAIWGVVCDVEASGLSVIWINVLQRLRSSLWGLLSARRESSQNDTLQSVYITVSMILTSNFEIGQHLRGGLGHDSLRGKLHNLGLVYNNVSHVLNSMFLNVWV